MINFIYAYLYAIYSTVVVEIFVGIVVVVVVVVIVVVVVVEVVIVVVATTAAAASGVTAFGPILYL